MDALTRQVAEMIDATAFALTPQMYGLATEDELMHQTFAGGARLVAMDKAQKIVALIRNGEKT